MENNVSEHTDLILRHLIDQAGLAYLEIDNNLVVRFWNKGAQTLFGLDKGQVLGRIVSEILPLDLSELEHEGISGDICFFHTNINGKRTQYQVHYIPIIDSKGEKAGIAMLIKDSASQREVSSGSRLKAEDKSMEDILGFAPVGIFNADLDGNLVMANSEYAWMLGYESAELLVQEINDFAAQVFYESKQAEDFMFILLEAERVTRFRCRLKRRDGSFIWALCYAMVTFDLKGRVKGFNGYAIDIGDTIRAENDLQKANEELMRLSVLDGLTQISNRRQFDTQLEKEWKQHLDSKAPLSAILCDIDFFKGYNDAYGHQIGDECLKRVAKAIDACTPNKGGLAARYGGEEFGVILPDTDFKRAFEIAEKIRSRILSLKIPHERSDVHSYVTLSLGTGTMVPRADASGMELLAASDKALYKAKQLGRNRSVSG